MSTLMEKIKRFFGGQFACGSKEKAAQPPCGEEPKPQERQDQPKAEQPQVEKPEEQTNV